MPYGVLTDIFCIILGGIIGPNLNIKITKCERRGCRTGGHPRSGW